ncbi:protein translocase subunit SecE [Companilactobacillus sp. RD055328]|uniref:preprotein translocase subunit SecE n=1 Tax=Companilactobacillus sp. RD055328 TaxID=2916634 RepID=UPI001FC82CA6|nr:preprotein translocase subunit SecE [Companilactobacillus sp. RD055328]GKQ42168.1 protein translocase subunit SecE [Companilactobacillus sp. RD055328]
MRLFKFFGEVKNEMKVVTWPTAKENRRDSWTVIMTSVMYGLFFAAIDALILFLLNTFVSK